MMNVPITQGQKWQKLQQDLGSNAFFEQKPDYQYLAIEKHTPVGNYLFLPYGPVASSDQGFLKAIDSLIDLASRHHYIFIRLEPQDPTFEALLPIGSKKVKNVEPAETWVLDLPKVKGELTLADQDIKSLLPSRLVRYYKSKEKQGITIIKSHDPADIHHLVDLQSALATEKGITTFSEDYLKAELSQDFATLYLVTRQREDGADVTDKPHTIDSSSGVAERPTDVLAAGLVFDDETTRYNLQGAQSFEGKKLHATGILTIELILDAVKAGKRTFDFWGIAPEGAPSSHPWAGFTAFKKTFPGREVKYAGTYDLPTNPLKYRLYRFLKRLKS
ncbi:peptidoglycan bridge formation glycyltransferase FemA/FemB family protein [Candidatus Saccharibacteria bacterium]|nr:peptidoglycan bridge formation glycyltransferase FemA/FemB family protein [Candidatus Saccharibacteria bacterium]